MAHDENVANQDRRVHGQHDSARVKKAYSSPVLKVHGTIQERTLAGDGQTFDGNTYS